MAEIQDANQPTPGDQEETPVQKTGQKIGMNRPEGGPRIEEGRAAEHGGRSDRGDRRQRTNIRRERR